MKFNTKIRNSFELQLYRVFRIKYDKLFRLCRSDNVDDVLEISALLRHLILDQDSLVEKLSKLLSLQCSFLVYDAYLVDAENVFSEDYSPAVNSFRLYNRAEFVSLKCILIENEVLQISELIYLIANCGGGIKHDEGQPGNRKLIHSLLETKANMCLARFQQISRIVILGLAEMRKVIDKQFSFLEQRKRRKQPQILVPIDGPSVLQFSKLSSLEAYYKINIDRDGCFIFSFVPHSRNDYPASLLEIGSRTFSHKIAVLLTDDRTLSLRLFRDKNDYSCCNLIFSPMRSNILFVSWTPTVYGQIRFECVLLHENEEVAGFTVNNCWKALEGKLILGQNPNSLNGAFFQWSGTFVLFEQFFSIDEFHQMCETKLLSEEISKTWFKEEQARSKAFVTRIYNKHFDDQPAC